MSLLEDFYASLTSEDRINRPHLPHSSVVYVRAAIRQNTGVEYDLATVEEAMRKEGMLSNADYGIPRWYAKKWLKPYRRPYPR